MSRNMAFSLPHLWGGRDCLLPVDVQVIRQLREAMGGDEILAFVNSEYAARAAEVYSTLGVADLTFNNVWLVFEQMIPLMSA